MRVLTPKEKLNYKTLTQAIDLLSTITFLYKDEGDTQFTKRTIEPFLIGDRKNANSTQISGWCLDLPQNEKCWRIYKLEIMEKITINSILFEPKKRKDYKKGKHSFMEHVRYHV